MNQIPFILHEATLMLYPSNDGGKAIAGAPIWFGACMENMSVSKKFNVTSYWPTGARHPKKSHDGHHWEIGIDRLWFLPTDTKEDFDPEPNQKFVLIAVWHDPRTAIWHRKTFYGVTCDSIEARSNGLLEFAYNQQFQAEDVDQASGTAAYYSFTTPPESTTGSPKGQYLFVYDESIVNGSYLLGHYGWPVDASMVNVRVAYKAGSGSSTTLEAEVNGSLSGVTVTLPAGSYGAASLVEQSADLEVPANSVIRWKVVSSPGESTSPYDVALVSEMTTA